MWEARVERLRERLPLRVGATSDGLVVEAVDAGAAALAGNRLAVEVVVAVGHAGAGEQQLADERAPECRVGVADRVEADLVGRVDGVVVDELPGGRALGVLEVDRVFVRVRREQRVAGLAVVADRGLTGVVGHALGREVLHVSRSGDVGRLRVRRRSKQRRCDRAGVVLPAGSGLEGADDHLVLAAHRSGNVDALLLLAAVGGRDELAVGAEQVHPQVLGRLRRDGVPVDLEPDEDVVLRVDVLWDLDRHVGGVAEVGSAGVLRVARAGEVVNQDVGLPAVEGGVPGEGHLVRTRAGRQRHRPWAGGCLHRAGEDAAGAEAEGGGEKKWPAQARQLHEIAPLRSRWGLNRTKTAVYPGSTVGSPEEFRRTIPVSLRPRRWPDRAGGGRDCGYARGTPPRRTRPPASR